LTLTRCQCLYCPRRDFFVFVYLGGLNISAESAAAFYGLLEKNRHDFTLEEMQKVIFGKNPEMTDEELEA